MTHKIEHECIRRLVAAGIERDDAAKLRSISMTLHRWHELECGNGDAWSSWCIARGYKRNGAFEYDGAGDSYLERHYHRENGARYARIPDRERGALKRLATIMAKYPALSFYIQGDPRGAALYILRPGDVREGASVDSCYSNGIAVYQ